MYERLNSTYLRLNSTYLWESGISKKPMKQAVAFESPASMEVTLELPHAGTMKGMGIRQGITLIVGGGYHGKSTLLQAIELGVYNHIAGDCNRRSDIEGGYTCLAQGCC